MRAGGRQFHILSSLSMPGPWVLLEILPSPLFFMVPMGP